MSYIPNTDEDRRIMLDAVGLPDLDSLYSPIPENLRFNGELNIPHRYDQMSLAKHAATLAKKNVSAEDHPIFLGAGIYDHYVPPTVAAITGRSEFYTSYTPYQPEVSQGVLQSIFEFQTLLCELTQMPVANASMYDGATALAEAAIMAGDLTGRKRLLVLGGVNPIHREVMDTYLQHMQMTADIVPSPNGVADLDTITQAIGPDVAGIVMQHPNFFGNLEDAEALSDLAHKHGALLLASIDPISLGLLTPPGAYGADIVVGEGQSLGCPMGFGGPLLGLFACKQEFIRRLPGRIVGQTKDADGKRAFVMTLRTREQDIRRERATSNICTNEALYALAACVYMATMGRTGMRQVADLCIQKSHYLAQQIAKIDGYELLFPDAPFFKEFAVKTPVSPAAINAELWRRGIIGGLPLTERFPEHKNAILIAVTEQRTKAELDSFVDGLRTAATSSETRE